MSLQPELNKNIRLLRPFFTFYGAKWRAAWNYPKPQHGTIIEPFAGSAGYALRYPSEKVVLIDKDSNIINTWRYLINASPGEIRRLPDVLSGQTVNDLAVCEEARLLIGWWLNKGNARPMKSPSKWMRDGMRPTSFWGAEIRERLANQVERIRHWKVIEGNYTDAPNIKATWFIDPPYVKSGKHYRNGSKDIDYNDLGMWCLDRKGQSIVCEQDGADWLPFRPFITIKANESCRGKKKSKEVLWLNDSVEMNRRCQ